MKKACFGRPGRVCARFEYLYRIASPNTPPQCSSADGKHVAFPPSRTLSEGCGTTGDALVEPRLGAVDLLFRAGYIVPPFPYPAWLPTVHLRQRFLGNAYAHIGPYLVDPASSHMLVSKIKPCMSKYRLLWTAKPRMAH